MELTKLGHSCFRLTSGGTTVVIDPGAFSDENALAGADVVLITHEHPDHVHGDRLREAAGSNPDLEVWTNETVAGQFADAFGKRIHAVHAGDTFTLGPRGGGASAGSLDVAVIGSEHACIHPDLPLIRNVGFLFPGGLFHPGDALTVPEQQVTTLLAPVAAPWLKISELIDWVRAVGPQQAYLMHDAVLSETGLTVYSTVAGNLTDAGVQKLPNGEPVSLS